MDSVERVKLSGKVLKGATSREVLIVLPSRKTLQDGFLKEVFYKGPLQRMCPCKTCFGSCPFFIVFFDSCCHY
jgi:hypothetical protein